MLSISMASSKPMGMSKRDYQEAQSAIAEEDFKFQTNQRIQNLQFAIDLINESLNESIAEQGSLKQACNSRMKEVVESTMLSLKEVKQSLGNLVSEFESHQRWSRQMKEVVDKKMDVLSFNEKISHLEDCIQKLHLEKESMSRDFKSSIEHLKQDFDARLKAMKQEIISMPSEIPTLRKAFDQKIELVELNGQNSVLRSSNNEKQIMLVERKIDNLYQLIKKLELSVQEAK